MLRSKEQAEEAESELMIASEAEMKEKSLMEKAADIVVAEKVSESNKIRE